jgi:ferredoxin
MRVPEQERRDELMGHLVGKDIYRRLGKKIDGLTIRAPWNETFHAILKELYSEDDADLVVRMPYGLSTIERLERVTRIPRPQLSPRLDSICERGLVMDVCLRDRFYYMPSPLVIGIFEYTMMRTRGGVDHKKVAGLFDEYLRDSPFYQVNAGRGDKVALMRALPHDGSMAPDEYVEVLDYEKASALVEQSGRCAIGICSCRHEKAHVGQRCKAPLDNCSTFGPAAVDFMVRHGFAREVSKTEMLENIARSRELGLMINADNVQRNVSFMCHCCGCCCNVLLGITRHGYPNTVMTSSYVARSDRERCKGCGVCSTRCPIQAIPRVPDPDPRFRKHGRPAVDESLCVGCGVCTVTCSSGAMKLHRRKQRVLHPEDTFARVILQCLEKGTLQNQLFDDPARKTHAFMRGVVGGFLLLPPVKQALMSDQLRSRFLRAMTAGAVRKGNSASNGI